MNFLDFIAWRGGKLGGRILSDAARLGCLHPPLRPKSSKASEKEGDNMTTYDTVMLVLAIVSIIVTLVGIKRK